jgi:hypothetical protein
MHAKPVHAKPVGKPAAKPVKPLGKPTSKPVKPSKPAHHHSHKHPDYESHIFGRNVMLYPDYPDFVLID